MSDWERLDDYRLRLPARGGMRTPGVIYADSRLEKLLTKDEAPQQVINVAHLPGIVGPSMAMPDIHWGYGFPIGGVAAFDAEDGVVSPGGVGYDINCGVRLAATGLDRREISGDLERLADCLYQAIPAGVGQGGDIRLGTAQLKKVCRDGAAWSVGEGWGESSNLSFLESQGALPDADPEVVSTRAMERGRDQLGTLGSGNHFLEVAFVEEIFDPTAADSFGLRPQQVVLWVHSGSRGLGHQVCDDFLLEMGQYVRKHQLTLPDRQLACAPVKSDAGRRYLGAMAAAANFAFANRQVLAVRAERALLRALSLAPRELAFRPVYDVAHNIAKIENHDVEGRRRSVIVHRKGATRAFGPGHPEVPERYCSVGQPVLVPGDMGTESYVLAGAERAMRETFGSCCHGAGRVLSRKAAMKRAQGRSIVEEMRRQGVLIRARQRHTLGEEMPEAYKDVSAVVEVVVGAGLARKVARLKPLIVIKG